MTDIGSKLEETLALPALPNGPLDARTLSRDDQKSRPWTRDQLAALCIADAISLIVVAVGAWQANSQSETNKALAWLAASLLGLAISGTAHATWLMRNRRVLALGIRLVTDPRRMAVVRPTSLGAQSDQDSSLVMVPGAMRYHRATCAFVDGRGVTTLTADEARHSAFYGCEVCSP